MVKALDWNNLKNILCIRLDNMGDVLMTSPAIRALKESVSDRKITLLTSTTGAMISGNIPEIDNTIVFDPPWVKDNKNFSEVHLGEIIKEIRKKEFDGAVIFNVYSQNPLPAAMLCFLSGIPRVAGFCRENPYKLITDWYPDPEPLFEIKHEITRQLDLVKMLGAYPQSDAMSLSISSLSVKKLHEKLRIAGVDLLQKYVIIHPGVSEPKRQYPVSCFAEAAIKIINELNLQIIVTGVEGEKALADEIINLVGKEVFNMTGKLNMEELICLIKESSVLIANNTGPVHIASAVGTPVVVLYALTNPQHTPWKVPHKILPFVVPEELQSRNMIISFANRKAFLNKPEHFLPCEIVTAVKELISDTKAVENTKVLFL